MPRRLWLAACAFAIVPVLAACGDDDGGADAASGSSPTTPGQSNATASGASPSVGKPVSKYSVSIEDIGNAWLTDVGGTFVIDAATYSVSSGAFTSADKGKELLRDWGYLEGYETGYIPEGRDDTVLKGGYYIKVETHLFSDAAGASKAFDYFSNLAMTSGGSPVTIRPVGNRSVGTATLTGKIAKTTVNALFHQVVFVRGNVLTIVLTKGAQGFMKVDSAWGLAHMADEKLLGERAAPEPTATSNYKTPTPTPKQ